MALSAQGEVFTWGQAGRLGHASQGAEVDEMAPRPVPAMREVQEEQEAAFCALDVRGMCCTGNTPFFHQACFQMSSSFFLLLTDSKVTGAATQ